MFYQEPLPPNSPPAARFDWIIVFLQRMLAEREREIGGPLTVAIWSYLARARRRFAALAARVAAGTLRPPRPRTLRPLPPGPPPPRRPTLGTMFTAANPPPPMPRGHAWLCRLLPAHAANAGLGLAELLRDPEMQVLLARAPQFGRILRPLLRMTGATPEREVMPPPPPPRRAPPRRRMPLKAKAPKPPRPPRQIPPERLQRYLDRLGAPTPGYRERRSRRPA